MKPYQIGVVYIDPVGTLAETAQILGDIFGLEFGEDDSGRYEQFPTYNAVTDEADMEYALLGMPEPKHDVTKNKNDPPSLNSLFKRWIGTLFVWGERTSRRSSCR
jgi:hypothetical protein